MGHDARLLKRTGRALLAGAASALRSPLALSALGEPLFWIAGFRKREGAFDLAAARSVLVIRLDELGDVALSAAFLRELRRNLPQARITLVVQPEALALVELCPHVDEILTLACHPAGRYAAFQNYARALRLAARSLWRQRFDLAVVPRWDTDHYGAAHLAFLSGARHRVGYAAGVNPDKKRRDGRLDRLYSRTLAGAALAHEARRSLDLLSLLGGSIGSEENEVWIGERDRADADGILAKAGIGPDAPLVAVAPGGGNSRLKEWPAGRFVELCRRLKQAYGARIALVGGPAETGLGVAIERVLGDGDVLNLVGKLPLRLSVAVVGRSRVFVGNDTGLMHLADAAGVPAIGIFGSSCPHRFGPWKHGRAVLGRSQPCGPCSGPVHRDRCTSCPHPEPLCLLEISVADVMDAVGALLSGGASAAGPRTH